MLLPRQKIPDLTVETLQNGPFALTGQTSERGTIMCFYRGLHCSICANYLIELEKQAEAFAISNNYPARGEYTGEV